MAKNNKLINSLAEVARRNREQHVIDASNKDVPQIYSVMALALWRTLDLPDEEKTDAIKMIFAESQKFWIGCINKGMDIDAIIKMCEDETGICVRGEGNE